MEEKEVKKVIFDEKHFMDTIHEYFSTLKSQTLKDKQRFYIWLDEMHGVCTDHIDNLVIENGENGIEVFRKSYLYKYSDFFDDVYAEILTLTNPTYEYMAHFVRKDSDLVDYLDDYNLITDEEYCKYADDIIYLCNTVERIPLGYKPPVRETLGFRYVFEID